MTQLPTGIQGSRRFDDYNKARAYLDELNESNNYITALTYNEKLSRIREKPIYKVSWIRR